MALRMPAFSARREGKLVKKSQFSRPRRPAPARRAARASVSTPTIRHISPMITNTLSQLLAARDQAADLLHVILRCHQ
jgi:hypothetical protein